MKSRDPRSLDFDYGKAFSRSLGWMTEVEREILRNERVAIAGMGGVGGIHLLTLTRLGIGGFNISDFDQFELGNFNRQAGAFVSNIGRPKLDVMAEMALDINPELDLKKFPEGIDAANLNAFLDGVDLYVDSLDFFALEIRRKVFAACHERGIPAITAAPLGMGSALLVFMPGEMSFEDYFRLAGHSEEEQALRFMLGLAPSGLHMRYLVDESRIDFNAKKGPSTPMACELCAGFTGSYALKILLGRGRVPVAPRGIHFDAYRNKVVTTWRPWGNANPIQRLALRIARKRVMAGSSDTIIEPTQQPYERPIERILDRSRWAPSGDNDQPWKFELIDDHRAVIHANDTRDWCVYDLDGTSSQIAVGALLETLSMAASVEGLHAVFNRRSDAPDTAPIFDVELTPDPDVIPHRLAPFIEARVTQRKPFSTRALSVTHKKALEQALGEGYRVHWIEGKKGRRRMARLLFNNAHIRLTTPEAYEVHKRNIEWGARLSEDRLPEHALGADFVTRKAMRWAMQSWARVRFLNRFFAGTWLPRLQMDLLAGLRCAAHFVILADRPLETIDDYLAGGAAMQRFWLEATRQGLQFQPEMTPLIFSRYVADSIPFTRVQSEQALAARLAGELAAILGPEGETSRRVYMGRVGFGEAPVSRSVRKPLRELLVEPVD